MKNFEELKQECIEKSDSLLEQFKEYYTENEEEDEETAFKTWVLQKLALAEVLQLNTNEQQASILNFLITTTSQIESMKAALDELKKQIEQLELR